MNRILFIAAILLLLSTKGNCHFTDVDYKIDSVPHPWTQIVLTGTQAKVLSVDPVVAGGAFPWIPVIGGVVAVGTVTYFLTKDDENDPVDCSFTASAQTTGTTCGLSNGSIGIQVNPADDYTYVWSNGATGSMIADVTAGTYTATITRTGTSCTEVVTTSISNQNPNFDATISTQPSACDQQNGSATVTPSPPGSYTYNWSNGSTQQNQTGLASGNYSVTVDAGGECEKMFNVQIGTSTFDATISFTTTPSTCGLPDGTAIANVDPPGTYTYTWSDGQSGSQASGLAQGSYSVTVSKDGTTCMVENSVTIEGSTPDFSLTLSSTPSGCGLTDGTATAVVDPTGDYTYAWSNGQSGPQAIGLVAGAYNVTVSITGTTCTQEASVTVDELPAGFTVSVSSTPSGCGLSDGTATATVDTPGDYVFTWSNGLTGAQVSGLAAGDYVVTVTVSGTDCSQQASVTIGSDPFPYTVAFTTTPSHCGAADGSASVLVTPQGEFGYQWSNGGNGAQLTGLGAGTYTVTVTDVVTSCAETFTVTVDELPAEITLSFTTTPAGCGVSNGSATVTADPPAAYTYLWSNGTTTPQLSGVASGIYSVTVTIMGTNCTNASSVEVEQAGGGFAATFSTDNADCGLSNGSANITIDPPAEYTYQWSNQQTGPALNQIPSGTYSVTVTDANSCKEEFSVTVSEDPAEFISVVSISPGDCTGGGDITFTLSTPGTGPLNVQVEGPQGTMPLSLPPGTYQLSAFISVLPGTYTITVYDEQIGNVCIEIETATVQDNTPSLAAMDDFYTTPAGQAVFENALDNDSGLNIQMTNVSDEFGGTVTFNADGDFTFVPEQGFSGEASFTYTVTDACGNVSTGIVTITVEQANCDFSVEFELTPASCGLEDGSISVDVIDPGTYGYIWSNGDSGPVINAVSAGVYTVTITDLNLGCDLEFSVVLSENPAEHIDDIIITQPACGVEGEIQFTLTTNSQNPLVMSVSHPNGDDLFFTDPGIILLSDYIAITAGEYTIEVFDAGAGPDCFESFTVTLVATPSLEIFAEAVIPPSEPTAMDGIAIIIAIVQGTLPYEILLNGSSWGLALDHAFQVTGLGAGAYTIQIVDANGCVSNILDVLIPFPPITMSFGMSMMQTEINESKAEPVSHEPFTLWRSILTGSMEYYIGNIRQEVIARYAVPVVDQPGFTELVYMTDIGRYTLKGVGFALQGGLGTHFEKQEGRSVHTFAQPSYVLLKASSGYTLAKRFRFYGSVEVRGWEKLEIPRVEIGLSIPFAKKAFRWMN